MVSQVVTFEESLAMKWLGWISLPVLAMTSLVMGVMTPAQGQKPALAMLDQLIDGRWELRDRGDKQHVERLCLKRGDSLIQLRHPALGCERLIVEDSPNSVTVQYTCHGQGYGRTHIRRETNQLVQIETQGIAGGLPFDFAAEGRRTGDCPA